MGKVTTYHKGDMLFETQLGKHKIMMDVPAGWGGQDRGATPPEFFIASLSSCVGAFVANYCNQVGLDASELKVDVTFEKLENPVCLGNLKVEVDLPNADIKGREKAILRVAEHCVVHETICHLNEGSDIPVTVSGKA